MSRSGYSEDFDGHWQFVMWRGAVASAIRGARGQAFLKEMLAAMDAMPKKKLTAKELIRDDEVCAIGAVGRARGVDMQRLDPEDYWGIASTFGIARALAQEIMFENDEVVYWKTEIPEQRFERIRQWIVGCIRSEA